MNVIVEKPVTWLKSKRDGERNRLMYARLLDALNVAGARVSEEEVYYGSDFTQRAAPETGIRLSYHSIGESENVWRIKESPIPFFYSIDRNGYSGWSELAIKPEHHINHIERLGSEDSNRFCEEITNWLVANNLSKYQQTTRRAPLPEQYIFLPLQVLSDRVATHYRLHPAQVLFKAVRMAQKHGKYLVVKRHPYCRNLLMNFSLQVVRHFGNVLCTDASVTQILPSSTAVITGNSGVGLEALAYGKPVFTFGKSEYQLASYQLDTLQSIDEIFSQRSHKEHPLGRRFVHYYLKSMCFDVRSPCDVQKKLSSLLQPGAWHKR